MKKKFVIEIKNADTGRLIDSYKCNALVGETEDGSFSLGEFEDESDRFSSLMTLIENQLLEIAQSKKSVPYFKKNKAEMISCFSEIQRKYDLKEDKDIVERLQLDIKSLAQLMIGSLINTMYDNTFIPKGEERVLRYKIIDENDNLIVEKKISDFGFLSTSDGDICSFFNAKYYNMSAEELEQLDNEETLDYKFFQTICNTIAYAIKTRMVINDIVSAEEYEEKVASGDKKFFEDRMHLMHEFMTSVYEFSKNERIANYMKHNKLEVFIDEDEYKKQQALDNFNNLMGMLGDLGNKNE